MAVDHFSILFFLLLFIVAFLYASVGHGGASGYLALMALFSVSPAIMKPSALILNIFVSLIAFLQFYRGGHFKWKLFYPFAITSIPAAFLGAALTLDAAIYKRMLGFILLFPILRLAGLFGKENSENRDLNIPAALLIGAVIGFLSGILGIGGGILLSPVILLLHWGKMKQTAAVSALFIFVNSIAGLISIFSKALALPHEVYLWLLLAVLGGFTGSFVARKNFSNLVIKRILAAVLLIASVKLIFTK